MIKKNQIIIFTIALMLIAAGYLNYKTGGNTDVIQTNAEIDSEEVAGLGDAKLVSSNIQENEENITDKENEKEAENKNEINTGKSANSKLNEKSNTSEKNEDKTSVQTSSNNTENSTKTSDDYFTNSRLTRDTMYSQMIESYQKILDNSSISADQKAISQTEIKKINDLKNSIMICENLIKTKGFKDVVIFVNDISISVIVKSNNSEMSDEEAARIQNIVAREMKADIENIHISNK